MEPQILNTFVEKSSQESSGPFVKGGVKIHTCSGCTAGGGIIRRGGKSSGKHILIVPGPSADALGWNQQRPGPKPGCASEGCQLTPPPPSGEGDLQHVLARGYTDTQAPKTELTEEHMQKFSE